MQKAIVSYCAAVGVLLLGSATVSLGDPINFTFTTITDPNALAGQTYVTGINNAGQIVGYYLSLGSGNVEVANGFVDTNGVFTTITDPNGIGNTYVTGINDLGQIAGYYAIPNDDHVSEGFVDTNGSFTDIGVVGLGGVGGINDAGQIAGSYANEASGFVDTNGSFTTITDPNADPSGITEASDINNLGQIVGTYNTISSGDNGFEDNNGSFTTIDDPNAAQVTYVTGLNDAGDIVGYYYAGTVGLRGLRMWEEPSLPSTIQTRETALY
jgi:hypothetical protein